MTIHETLIDQLCARHGVRRHGFNQAVADLISGVVPLDDRAAERRRILDFMQSINVVPDCFSVGFRRQAGGHGDPVVRVWEVVVTSPLKPSKLAAYWSLFWFLDNEGVVFTLMEVDRHGHETIIVGDGAKELVV